MTPDSCPAAEPGFNLPPRGEPLGQQTVVRPEVLIRIRMLQALICILPFVVLFWLTPLCGRYTIGHDYPIYSIQYQMELQYSLAHGTFPLYSPGFAGGRSAAALTLGEVYHPLSHLAAHSPGYWKGYALEWNTFWRLLSLGLTQLVLFNLLRKLQLRPDLAFVLSFLTVYHQRMLDMFRYGASLENYTGFLLLCAAIVYLYITPGDRPARLLAVIGASYLVITGGHPQIAYYGMLGAALVCLVTPAAIAAIWHEPQRARRAIFGYYARVGLCVGIGLILASAYTFPFYAEFLNDAPYRVGLPYEASLAFSDNWIGELNSFFNPLLGDVHGAFGGSSLLLIGLLAPIAVIENVKGRAIILWLWVALAAVVLCSAGSNTPVHYLFWRCFPLAGSFRTPGRITMVLAPIFMFLLIWFFRESEEGAPPQTPGMRRGPFLLRAAVLFIAGFILLPGLRTSGSGTFTPSWIQSYPRWVDVVVFATGLGALLFAAARVSGSRFRGFAGCLLGLAVVLQAAVQLRYGTWIETRQPTPTLSRMNEEKRLDLSFRGDPGFGMQAEIHVLTESPAFSAVFSPIETNRPMPKWFSGTTPVFPALGTKTNEEERLTNTYSSFNRVFFHATTLRPGFLILSAPYSPRWRASLDSRAAPVYRTDDNEQAVLLPAGTSDVEFRFHSSASVAGVLVSCLTALGLGIYFSARCLAGWVRAAVIVASFLVLAAGFAAWSHSLYHGENLGPRRVWISDGAN